jgi:hypothetical protein
MSTWELHNHIYNYICGDLTISIAAICKAETSNLETTSSLRGAPLDPYRASSTIDAASCSSAASYILRRASYHFSSMSFMSAKTVCFVDYDTYTTASELCRAGTTKHCTFSADLNISQRKVLRTGKHDINIRRFSLQKIQSCNPNHNASKSRHLIHH